MKTTNLKAYLSHCYLSDYYQDCSRSIEKKDIFQAGNPERRYGDRDLTT